MDPGPSTFLGSVWGILDLKYLRKGFGSRGLG